jgi:coenzyme F420 hydrogenase subunit beta
MPKDPVCANYVSKDTPYKQELEGRTYYFCSSECAGEFEQNYEDYLEIEEEIAGTGE